MTLLERAADPVTDSVTLLANLVGVMKM